MFVGLCSLLLIHLTSPLSAVPVADNSGNSTPPSSGTQVPGSSGTNLSHHSVIQRDGPGYDKIFKDYVLPVVFGVKMTAVLVAVFTALKLWVVQSLMVSKTALLGATILAAKAAYDHVQQKIKAAKLSGWDTNAYHQPGWSHSSWAHWPQWRDWPPYFSHPYQPTDHSYHSSDHSYQTPELSYQSPEHSYQLLDHSYQSPEHTYQPTDHHHHQTSEQVYQPYDHIHASIATQRDRMAIPHIHPTQHNDTFHVRSDAVRPTTTNSSPTVIGFKDIVTKITETTYDK